MRYNRSLFTVYSFISFIHPVIYSNFVQKLSLASKTSIPPFFAFFFPTLLPKIKYHLILTKNENN